MIDTDLVVRGMLPLTIAVSAVLTLPLSLILLWLYRRAVLRGMRASAGLGPALQEPPGAQAATVGGVPLTIVAVDDRAVSSLVPAAGLVEQAARRALRRAMLVYVLAGLAYAIVNSVGLRMMAAGGPVLSFGNLFMTVSLAWPTVMASSILAARDRRETLTIVGTYLAALIAVGIAALAVNPDASSMDLGLLWLFLNGPSTLLLSAFLTRRVRAVGPLVLAFTIVGVSGALGIIQAIGSSEELVSLLARSGAAIGLGGGAVFVLLTIAGFAVLTPLGAWLLSRIGHSYRRKRISDVAITLDAMWLVFAVTQGLVGGLTGLTWAMAGLAAYKLVTWVSSSHQRRASTTDNASPMLLLLRVFSLGRRSERLFDKLTKGWLRAGSVSLIAGPDLLTGTVEPHEFLDFLGRKLSRRFVSGKEDLSRRLARIDTRPDPDGRYRVNTFFCRADTWQMTMRRLATRCDAVLMDLRSFSPTHQGCLYELEQLLVGIPVTQFVLVVDDTTDQSFLELTLHDLWARVPPDSPNRDMSSPEVRLFRVQSGSGAEVHDLLRLLFGMCQQEDTSPRTG